MPQGGSTHVAPDPSQLEKALSVMLQGGHLTAGERLAFFQTSKVMAQAVLRHAVCTHLTLTLGESSGMQRLDSMFDPSSSSASTSTISSSARAHAAVAQQLAAESPNVTLTLRHGMVTPSACLQQRITTIQLFDLPIGQSTRSLLQLHELPRLHTLSLQQCRTDRNQPKASLQHISTSVRTLECIGGRPIPHMSDPFYSAYSFLLVDRAQLQTLITGDPPTCIFPSLPDLPALQQLRLLSCATRAEMHYIQLGIHNERAAVTDDDFQQLLAHPQLARVELPQTDLSNSHVGTPCAWDSLLLHDVKLVDLARMPLAGLQSCIVRGRLIADLTNQQTLAEAEAEEAAAEAEEAAAAPAAAAPAAAPAAAEAAAAAIGPMVTSTIPHLVLKAAPNYAGCHWFPRAPTFTLSFLRGHHNKDDQGKVIHFSMRHLAPDTALVIKSFSATRSPDFLTSLAAAPVTLTTICFTNTYGYDAMAGAGAGVLTHLPVHVSRVILELETSELEGDQWLDLLDYFIAGLQRPLRLTLITNKSLSRWQPWDADKQQEVHDWMADNGSQAVQVEFEYIAFSLHELLG